MKLVGKEGQRIETPPVTAFMMPGEGGAKAETLAQQDSSEKGGKMTRVSDEELKKMGLDPGVVEGARRELAEVAGGKGWKLEVFDVGEGAKELRGIVEGDDDDGYEYSEGEGQAEEDEQQDGSGEVYKDEL